MKIIYHSRDLDGYTSGAILKQKFPKAELVGYDYGQPLPQGLEGEDIIMVDVSLKMDVMSLVAAKAKSFVWIDHHISAMKDFREWTMPKMLIQDVLDEKISACEGAWMWANPGAQLPLSVKLLGMYDTWRNQDAQYWENVIMPFQYGMRSMCASPESFPTALFNAYDQEDLQEIIDLGKVILEYQRSQDAIAAKNCFEFTWKGFRILALNGGGFNSRAFISAYNPERHDIMMPFRFNGKIGMWDFSLYSEKEIDCSVLAKEMGGGGHKKAAGFQVRMLGLIIPGQ